jgi:flagellar biosynthesis protein FlhF
MRIKKFIADSLREGKSRIIKEMGEDAIILSSRNITDPKDANKSLVEIVAAIDNMPSKPSPSKLPVHRDIVREQSPSMKDQNDFLSQARQLYDEIDSIKDTLNTIAESVKYKNSSVLSPIYDKIYKALIDADFSEQYALNIAGDLSSDENINTIEEAIRKARYLITKDIKTVNPLDKGESCKTVLFFGPTGAGKTLSLVKLAIVSKLVMNANTLIISADMHKVGGAEQLETYASIASIPFKAVYSSEELQNLVSQESYRDIILIDTTGRSPKNEKALEELQDIADSIILTHRFLVQSAVVSKATFGATIQHYGKLKPDALILTKIDEAETLGNIVEQIKLKAVPVAYFTTGQIIPDDIEPAERDKLSKIILPDTLVEQK